MKHSRCLILLCAALGIGGCRVTDEMVIPMGYEKAGSVKSEPAAVQTPATARVSAEEPSRPDSEAPVATVPAEPPKPAPARQGSAAMEKRFSENGEIQSDPLQTVTMWAQRYDEVSRKADALRESNSNLVNETNRLTQENEKLKLELGQARKDIEQSNALLEQAHIELSKWKADVLGFREEIRKAQAAQLEALSKILRVLGAESVTTRSGQPAQDTKP